MLNYIIFSSCNHKAPLQDFFQVVGLCLVCFFPHISTSLRYGNKVFSVVNAGKVWDLLGPLHKNPFNKISLITKFLSIKTGPCTKFYSIKHTFNWIFLLKYFLIIKQNKLTIKENGSWSMKLLLIKVLFKFDIHLLWWKNIFHKINK